MSSVTEGYEAKPGLRETPNGKWTIRFAIITILAYLTRKIIDVSDFRFGLHSGDVYIIAFFVLVVSIILGIISYIQHRRGNESTKWIVIWVPLIVIIVFVGFVGLLFLALSALT